jgi:hypothetical protein
VPIIATSGVPGKPYLVPRHFPPRRTRLRFRGENHCWLPGERLPDAEPSAQDALRRHAEYAADVFGIYAERRAT